MRFTAWIVLVATLMLWSGNWIVARAVREEIAPGIATVGRLVIVLAILAPFAWFGLKNKVPGLRRRDWQVLAALGFTGGGLHLALQWLGLHYTTATSGILYLSMSPIFILVMARRSASASDRGNGRASQFRSAASTSSPRRAGRRCPRSTSAISWRSPR
jgi:drug/metabolite transporter (DMT)-like permease